MSNSRTITSIYECSEAPESLPDFIRWMQAKLEEIPEECRQAAKIEVKDYYEYYNGLGCPDYIIRYIRSEIKKSKKRVKEKMKAREKDEREQLARLKRKYEMQS